MIDASGSVLYARAMKIRAVVGVGLALCMLSACSRESQSNSQSKANSSDPQHETTETKTQAAVPTKSDKPQAAQIGKPAPDFSLADLDGNQVQLASFKGKTVVLEWFNPGCPFVQRSHTKGSLVDTAARHMHSGVVWLAINSGGPGKQGHGAQASSEAKQRFKMTHPVLLDEDGAVGKAYGAERTPHLFVIDQNGTLVYRGAIDNSPDAEQQSPQGGTLINYVDQALAELAKGQPVSTPQTEAYGCSVKYAD